MALIKTVRGFTPRFGSNCYLADNSTVIGDVVAGDECSIWFGVVIRGDVNSIRIGNRVNVQDNSVMHCTFEKTTIVIGNNVSIGHNVIVHGAHIGDNVLVGMGAVLMDDVVVEPDAIIAAGAVVLEKTRVESGTIYGGVPARRIKEIERQQIAEMVERHSGNYLRYADWYRE
ncbi:MAG: gamma carbonic anhydrase family protein [Marinilabiliales bacterium]|nr:MAG: gamma carbonic anhydrase family protein [Marinilabiliales bacterium]